MVDTVTESVFTLSSDGSFDVTPEVYDSYWKYGYILVKKMISSEELNLMLYAFSKDTAVHKMTFEQSDDKGYLMKLALWDHPSDDAPGLFARSEKIAGTLEKLLGDEVYHYHSKYLEKPPRTGGSFIWHQDYGYWYYNGNLYPDDMCTVFLALDDIDKENGCLKIIPKSFKAGRIDHIKYDEQIQADLTRVEQYKKRMGLKHVVMEKGDALIFHSNTLHRSDKNDSDRRRLALAVAYNTKRNNPIKEHHHPCYTPLVKVSNNAILEWGTHRTFDTTKNFYDPSAGKAHMDNIDN